MTRRTWVLMLCGLALGSASSVYAQNSNSGDIRGTVTDSAGALVPGVTVTVTNNDTGVISKFVTNNDGIYDTSSILPGNYTVEFSKGGFETVKRGPVPLEVGIVSIDTVLKVGSATEVIQVSSDAPLLKTEDAQVSTTLGLNQLSNLPNVDPANGWTYLLKLLPGATSTASTGGGGGGGGGDEEPQLDQAIGGTMPYFASYLVDGGSIWLPHSANIDQGLSESVSELNVIATDAPAQYGGGGSVFNVISKGGTDRFHGSAYENFQNDDLNARSYFDAPPLSKAKQRFNYYGFAVGGPILKSKFFFYYNFQQLKNPNSSYSTFSVPTAAMEAGCFNPTVFGNALTLDNAHGGTPLTTNPAQCKAADPTNYQTDLAIPTADFDAVAKNIQALFPAPNLSGFQNNYNYLKPSNGNETKHFGRLDYSLTSKNRVSLSVVSHWEPNKTNYDPGPVCPVNCENNAGEGWNAQITDVYTINSSLVNEFRESFVRQGNWFVPQSLGKGFPTQLGLQYSYANIMPSVNIGGTNGPGGLGPGTNAIFIENTFIPSDMVTLIKGKHILHFGGELMFAEDNSTPWGSINGATVNFSGQFTTSNPTVSEVGYADFLLGDVNNWSVSTQPSHEMRAKNGSLFAQDDVKLRPNLTLNLGVRVEIHGGFTENHNHMGGFDPTIPNPVASPGPAFPVNSMGSIWFAGLNGEHSNLFQTKALAMPRLGFAWTMSPNWVLRGAVGQYSALWSMDTVGGPVGFGTGVTGNLETSSATTPVVQLSGSGSNLPIIQGRNPSSYILPSIAGVTVVEGDGFIPYTPYNLDIMNGWQWTGGVQRRLPGNMVAEAEYVGSHWNNLMFEADINQIPASKLGCPSSPSNLNACRPFPQFTGIGIGSGGSRTGSYNGISNYEAAEFMLHKPVSYGLAVEAAYTWSRLYDDMDSSGWGNQYGESYLQDAYTPSANYGPSNFNRQNSFKATALYALPLGKGHQYLNSTLDDEVLGGWQASAAIVAYSGSPFTVTMASPDQDGSLGSVDNPGGAPTLYPNLTGNPNSGGHSVSQWFNPGAYTNPAANTFGNNKRNSLYGPRIADVDFSLGKSWGLGWEQGKFEIRADAYDLFNHPGFADPNSTIGNGGVGTITSTTINGRTMQLTGRFQF
jgi:hypothetical protein